MGAVEELNKELVRSFFEMLSADDLEGVRRLFHEDATWTVMAQDIPGAGAHEGRDEIIDGFLRPIRGMFEPGDPKVTLDNVVAEGSWVAVEATGRGRFRNGRVYDNSYVFVLQVEDGGIRTLREYMDTQHVSTLVGP